MRIINGFRLYDSIREIPTYNYFQFQKHYVILVNTETAILGEVGQIFQRAVHLLGKKQTEDAINLLQNGYIAVWKDAKSYSDIFRAAMWLSPKSEDTVTILEDISGRHIGYMQLLAELKLVVNAFEQEVAAAFPDLEAGKTIADYRKLKAALLNTDIEKPEESLDTLFEEIAAVTEAHKIERFDPSDPEAFQNTFDTRVAEWYQAMNLKEKDMKELSYFDFLARSKSLSKKLSKNVV